MDQADCVVRYLDLTHAELNSTSTSIPKGRTNLRNPEASDGSCWPDQDLTFHAIITMQNNKSDIVVTTSLETALGTAVCRAV